MKNKKMSRLISVSLSVLMVMGCAALNTYAEDFVSDIEVTVEEEMSADVEEISVGEEEISVGEEEIFVDDAVYSDDFSVVEEEGLIADMEIIVDEADEVEVEEESESETESAVAVEGEFSIELSEEVDTAEVDAVLYGSSDAQASAGQTKITLNYDVYTMTTVGETLMLVATVTDPAQAEDEVAVPETSEEEIAVIDENSEYVEEEVLSDTTDVSDDTALVETTVVDEFVAEVAEFEDNVSWTSSNEEVATVDELGMVTAVASGEAIITCTLDADQNVTATCKITVSATCALQEHVHSREDCFVRELICSHTFEEEHTADCYMNMFVCGLEEHVHDEACFNSVDTDSAEVEYDESLGNTVVQ